MVCLEARGSTDPALYTCVGYVWLCGPKGGCVVLVSLLQCMIRLNVWYDRIPKQERPFLLSHIACSPHI